MRLLFLHRSTCSGEMTLPVKGPISVPALIQVLEKMPSPSPGMELWAMITSEGSTRLDSFCTSAGGGTGLGKGTRRRADPPAAPLPPPRSPGWRRGRAGVPGEQWEGSGDPWPAPAQIPGAEPFKRPTGFLQSGTRSPPGLRGGTWEKQPGLGEGAGLRKGVKWCLFRPIQQFVMLLK